LLRSYDWPGNVRELQNAMERALILAKEGVLHLDLPVRELPDPAPLPLTLTPANAANGHVFTEAEIRDLETRNTGTALAKAHWKIHGPGGAAQLLGLKPTTLISRIKKMGLRRPG
jgi:transcriptional regulator with GAF, ATPase, and Fis domain